VIEDNNLTDTQIYIKSGSHHVIADNNVIKFDNDKAIVVDGHDAQDRSVNDVTIINNTAVNMGTKGNFLSLKGAATNVVMKDNLFIAPNLVVGAYGTADVYANTTDLSSFSEIDGNVWAIPGTITKWANSGINYVGTTYTSEGHETSTDWNALPQVGTDTFENVSLTDSYQIMLGGAKVGAAMALAA